MDSNDNGSTAVAEPKPAKAKPKGKPVKGPKKPATPAPPKKAPKPAASEAPQQITAPVTSDGTYLDQYRDVAERFKSVADASRMGIVMLLEKKPMTVTEICEVTRVSQPAVSHHMALLRHCGLIKFDRDGKHNSYRLTDRGRRVFTVAVQMIAVG